MLRVHPAAYNVKQTITAAEIASIAEKILVHITLVCSTVVRKYKEIPRDASILAIRVTGFIS